MPDAGGVRVAIVDAVIVSANVDTSLTFTVSGVAAGAILGILFAPDKGSETRRKISDKGKDYADGMICGTWGTTALHLQYIDQVLGKRPGGATSTPQDVPIYACMNGLLLPDRQVFLVDTHVNYDPTAEQLADITVMAAEEMKRFGIHPKAALLSHSNFGSSNQPSAIKMRNVLEL